MRLKEKVEKLTIENLELMKKINNNEERIQKLEDIVFALKDNVKKQKQTKDIERKRMWLNGYPDETVEDKS